MALSIVSGLVGVALVWLSLRALRRGTFTLPGGEQKLERRQTTFWFVVLGLFAAGVGAIVSAVSSLGVWLDPDPGPLRTFEGSGFTIDVPAAWQGIGEPDDAMAAVTFGHPQGELVVLFPPPAKLPHEDLREFADGARDPSIRYRQWDVKLEGTRLAIDMRYPSPRGEVIGRLVAVIDTEGKLRSVHALCTFEEGESRAALCERIVSSLVVP